MTLYLIYPFRELRFQLIHLFSLLVYSRYGLFEEIYGLVQIKVLQMFFDLAHGKTDRSEFSENVQSAYVVNAVHSVAVAVSLRLEYPELFIISQGIGSYVVQGRYFADLVIFFHFFTSHKDSIP